MNAGRVALVLLAAGRGSRFGGGKLAAPLGGMTVAAHAAEAFDGADFGHRIAVCGPDTPDLPGFARIMLDPPGAPLSQSIAMGVAAAEQAGCEAVMLALADMPLVPAGHVTQLLARFDGDRIATLGPQPMPPAMFGRRHFAALRSLEGDRGAGYLLRDAPGVALEAPFALDIDSVEDLAKAEAILRKDGGRGRD